MPEFSMTGQWARTPKAFAGPDSYGQVATRSCATIGRP